MPTRKQRRRKAKTFRHEFDYVVYDDEGNEVEVDPADLRAQKEKDAPKPKPTAGKTSSGRRPIREVPPPSWPRSVRRGLPMGAVMLVVVLLLFKDMPLLNRVLLGAFYAAAFVPFSYWIDRMSYRNYLRRSGRTE